MIIDYFNRMVQELSGMETLRTDFIANVPHELKTPLAVIQNYGTMLQQPDLSEQDRRDYARTVTDASQRLANLITNILKLNKLENQQIYPKKECFDLGEQLCECLLGFENAWESKKLEIGTDIEDGVTVESDAELLSLVWNNLFSNAIKFTEAGGTVGLRLYTEPSAMWPALSASTPREKCPPELRVRLTAPTTATWPRPSSAPAGTGARARATFWAAI